MEMSAGWAPTRPRCSGRLPLTFGELQDLLEAELVQGELEPGEKRDLLPPKLGHGRGRRAGIDRVEEQQVAAGFDERQEAHPEHAAVQELDLAAAAEARPERLERADTQAFVPVERVAQAEDDLPAFAGHGAPLAPGDPPPGRMPPLRA